MMDVANLAGYDDIHRLIIAIDPDEILPTLEIYDTYRE
jgi:hypothetical protein